MSAEPKIVGNPNAEQRARLRAALEYWPERLGYKGRMESRCPCANEYLDEAAGRIVDQRSWYGIGGIIRANDWDPSETQRARATRMKAHLEEFAKEPEGVKW